MLYVGSFFQLLSLRVVIGKAGPCTSLGAPYSRFARLTVNLSSSVAHGRPKEGLRHG